MAAIIDKIPVFGPKSLNLDHFLDHLFLTRNPIIGFDNVTVWYKIVMSKINNTGNKLIYITFLSLWFSHTISMD